MVIGLKSKVKRQCDDVELYQSSILERQWSGLIAINMQIGSTHGQSADPLQIGQRKNQRDDTKKYYTWPY